MRAKLRDFLAATSPAAGSASDLRSQADQQIFVSLREFIGLVGGRVAVFSPSAEEPALQLEDLELSVERAVYPRVQGEALAFYQVHADTRWTANVWGIQEPVPESATRVELSDCEMVLVPGLAFDRQGRRLGRGKGYYDRALENFLGIKVGVAYAVQLLHAPLPQESHDIRMNYVVTEKYTLKPRG